MDTDPKASFNPHFNLTWASLPTLTKQKLYKPGLSLEVDFAISVVPLRNEISHYYNTWATCHSLSN